MLEHKIIPGNSGSLWNAVKVLKDVNKKFMTGNMDENNHEILNDDLPDRIAHFWGEEHKIYFKWGWGRPICL